MDEQKVMRDWNEIKHAADTGLEAVWQDKSDAASVFKVLDYIDDVSRQIREGITG